MYTEYIKQTNILNNLSDDVTNLTNIIKKLFKENKTIKNQLVKINNKLNNCFVKSVIDNTESETTKIIVFI